MTDLRDQLPAFEAAARRLLTRPARIVLVHSRPARCHPDRPYFARNLCTTCYNRNRRAGTLHQHPTRIRRLDDFAPDYALLRSEGYTRTQIAERLHMQRGSLDAAYRRAVAAGVLEPDRRTA